MIDFDLIRTRFAKDLAGFDDLEWDKLPLASAEVGFPSASKTEYLHRADLLLTGLAWRSMYEALDTITTTMTDLLYLKQHNFGDNHKAVSTGYAKGCVAIANAEVYR